MKNFRIQIRYTGYYADFTVKADDTAIGIEKAILDKIGKKSKTWESTGMFRNVPNRITYEEGVDVTRPVQTKTVLGVEVAVGV